MDDCISSLVEGGAADLLEVLALFLEVDAVALAIVEDVETVLGANDVASERQQRIVVGNLGDDVDPLEIECVLEVVSTAGAAPQDL